MCKQTLAMGTNKSEPREREREKRGNGRGKATKATSEKTISAMCLSQQQREKPQ